MTQFTCKGVKQINNWISLNMTFTFTIRISRNFPSAREFQMGNFQKYWSQNVGKDFLVLHFFHGQKILKVDGRDGRDPQNREKIAPAEGSHVWWGINGVTIIFFFIIKLNNFKLLQDKYNIGVLTVNIEFMWLCTKHEKIH